MRGTAWRVAQARRRVEELAERGQKLADYIPVTRQDVILANRRAEEAHLRAEDTHRTAEEQHARFAELRRGEQEGGGVPSTSAAPR